MFDKKNPPSTVTIHRVRNGFELTATNGMQDGRYHDPYVFENLAQLYDFLIENDFEVTEE